MPFFGAKSSVSVFSLILLGFLLAGIFAVPILVYAQGLVPCGLRGGPLCTICDFFVLFQNVLTFIFTFVLAPVGALFLGWGGFMMIFPGAVGQASASSYEKGKTIIKNVVIGIIIALLAWLLIDTFMKALGSFQYGETTFAEFGPWNEIQCTATPPEIPQGNSSAGSGGKQTHKACAGSQCIDAPGSGPASCPQECDGFRVICNSANICQVSGIEGPNDTGCSVPSVPCGSCDAASLAAQYNTSPTNKNDPELDAFLACLDTQLSPVVNRGSVFTYEVTNPLCNQTRGDKTNACTPGCAHVRNSCHYGGANGSAGALAVDFGNEDAGDKIIEAANKCPQTKAARCETSSGQIVSCSSPSATHVHISTRKCSGT